MKYRKVVFILVFLAFLYILISSLIVYRYQHRPGEDIFALGFRFGPLIRNIVVNNTYAAGGFSAHRMPFIPYFLSAIALIHNNLLFAYFIKNLIFFSLLFLSIIAIMGMRALAMHKYLLLPILAFGLSFPQLVLHSFSIEYEEGYLVVFISVLFLGLLAARDIKDSRIFLGLAIVNSLVFLTKGSMVFLTIATPLFFYWITKNRKAFLVFALCILGAFLMWASFNLRNSGRFTIFSSLNGYEFYKGNNELSLSVYPKYSLDEISGKIWQEAPKGNNVDEWDVSEYYMKKALEFIKTHPQKAIRLFLSKVYAMFFKLTNAVDKNNMSYLVLMKFGMMYMFAFRVVFLACIYVAIRRLFINKDKSISFVYLGFILTYSFPSLVGFAYERHVMPLVPITLFYLIYIIISVK